MNNTLELRSTVHISDTISELPSLSINNTPFLRKKIKRSEISKDLYKSNKNEVAIHFVQILKNSMDAEMRSLIEPYSTKKLSSLVRKSFLEDDILSISKCGDIVGYDFGANKETCSRFRAKCFIRKGDHKGNVLLHIPAFTPSDEFIAPKEATNFKVSSKLIALSNFRLDEKNKQYLPVYFESHGLVSKYETTMLPLIKIQTQPITTRLNIRGVKLIQNDADTVLLTAIKFYKYSNGKFEHLADDGCLSITQIF